MVRWLVDAGGILCAHDAAKYTCSNYPARKDVSMSGRRLEWPERRPADGSARMSKMRVEVHKDA